MDRKIFIVEDHPVMREGYATLIQREEGLALCGMAETAPEALDRIPETDVDLVLVDVSLEGISGIELVKQIKALRPDLPMLVISAHDEILYAERALRAGARGYIMKHESLDTVLEAIRSVLQGELYLSDQMRMRIVQLHVSGASGAEASPLQRLSDRELEVFEHLGRGLTTRQVAEALHISPKTVETYRANIKEKLGLENTNELLQRAVLWVEGLAGS